jgi:outer membrane protein TolC
MHSRSESWGGLFKVEQYRLIRIASRASLRWLRDFEQTAPPSLREGTPPNLGGEWLAEIGAQGDLWPLGGVGRVRLARYLGHLSLLILLLSVVTAFGQNSVDPLGYSISTPRPIDPAAGTTNPSALATQRQNPFLGSAPAGKPTGDVMHLSLSETIALGLRFNLGVIESTQTSADIRAQRLRSLAALLPDVSFEATDVLANASLKEFGLKLPAIPGIPALPATTGAFGFQDARLSVTQSIYNSAIRNSYQAEKHAQQVSLLSSADARDVVVYAVGTSYFQVVAAAARLETTRAQLVSARELDQQTADRVNSQVSPEIDSLRARVARQSAEQLVTNAANELEKARLTLGRITGLPSDQKFTTVDTAYRPVTGLTAQSAIAHARELRSDLLSAAASIREAESRVRSAKGEKLPALSFHADYGAAGVNLGSLNQVYTIAGQISVPVFTGGRIQADIDQAQTNLARRQAEYDDLEGRVVYDVRVAWLDMQASDSSVSVAESNRALAERALAQSQDRYLNGVTNYLEVLRAQEAVTTADENYIRSVYSFNVAKIALARAMGAAASHIQDFFGGK